MGSLYQRGDIWWVKYFRAGRAFRESSRSKLKGDAKRLLKLREGQVVEHRFAGLKVEKILWDELAADLVVDYKNNENRSLGRAELSLKHLKAYFSGMKAADISTTHVEQYKLKRIEEEASNATINRELAALKRIFSLGAKQTPPKVVKSPYIPMLKENNVRTGYFEYEEYRALRGALPGYLKPVLTTAFFTGMRREEILSLTRDKVDLVRGTISLDPADTKNKEPRVIYLTGELYQAVSEQIMETERLYPSCKLVFHHHGRRIGSFRKTWASACKKVGLEGRIFHDLRRSAVRAMVRAGVPERVCMRISGHKTRSVFDRYQIVNEADLKTASDKVSGLHRAQFGHNPVSEAQRRDNESS